MAANYGFEVFVSVGKEESEYFGKVKVWRTIGDSKYESQTFQIYDKGVDRQKEGFIHGWRIDEIQDWLEGKRAEELKLRRN